MGVYKVAFGVQNTRKQKYLLTVFAIDYTSWPLPQDFNPPQKQIVKSAIYQPHALYLLVGVIWNGKNSKRDVLKREFFKPGF